MSRGAASGLLGVVLLLSATACSGDQDPGTALPDSACAVSAQALAALVGEVGGLAASREPVASRPSPEVRLCSWAQQVTVTIADLPGSIEEQRKRVRVDATVRDLQGAGNGAFLEYGSALGGNLQTRALGTKGSLTVLVGSGLTGSADDQRLTEQALRDVLAALPG